MAAWVGEAAHLDAHMRDLGLDVVELPDIGEQSSTSVEQVLANLEAGYWSACWGIDPQTRRDASLKTRAWAERELGDVGELREAYEYEVWRAYRLAK